jgi:nucleotide-binding universal stress UspA family protein
MRTILVGLDGSPRAQQVLHVAADLARSSGATLILFRSMSLPPVTPEALGPLAFPTDEMSVFTEARQYLEGSLQRLPQPAAGMLKVGIGPAWKAICDAAKEEAADLIVIGSHGHGLLDRILGTTAMKVVSHAEISVLVVRHPEQLGDFANARSIAPLGAA